MSLVIVKPSRGQTGPEEQVESIRYLTEVMDSARGAGILNFRAGSGSFPRRRRNAAEVSLESRHLHPGEDGE